MADNVTPICTTPDKHRPKREAGPKIGLKVRESEDDSGFNSLDVVNGLHGVCVALDDAEVNAHNTDNVQYLAQAAKVLSAIIQDRVILD